MLKKLIIENYAIIDRIEVEFGPGLNILTGETGAGKSIIADAVNLLAGERMHSGILRKGAKKGFIEGIFDTGSLSGLDKTTAGELIEGSENGSFSIRRDITASGGSRVYINNRLSTVQKLKSYIEGIIDLHGQHQHQSLMHTEKYYEIIDRYGGNINLAKNTSESYYAIAGINDEIKDLKNRQTELEEKRDFLEFQLKEIRAANLRSGEEEELEQEWKMLQNAEKIASMTREGFDLLYDSKQSAAVTIRKAGDLIEDLKGLLPDAGELSKDIEQALVSVEESAQVLLKFSEHTEHDPQRLEEISSRLSELRGIQKKYRTDIDGILQKEHEIELALQSDESLKDEILQKEQKLSEEKQRFGELCQKLSQKRTETALKLERSVITRLKKLGMEKSLFSVSVEHSKPENSLHSPYSVATENGFFSGSEHGIDSIQFNIATGKSEHMMPVSQIASGGELSRIMLAIKSALMKADRIPVLIFDEIDTGISGRIASAVGRELLELSKHHQLLCITHLPQIAGIAEQHYSVEKSEESGRIVTRIRKLNNSERRTEIAKLLAGDDLSEYHLRSAEELIKTPDNK